MVNEWKDFNKELDDLILLLELSEEEDSTDTLKELEKESKHLLDQVKSLGRRDVVHPDFRRLIRKFQRRKNPTIELGTEVLVEGRGGGPLLEEQN